GTLYRESGDATGFDDKDTAVSGSVTFSKGTARINLNSALTLTASGGTFYLVVGVTSSATPGIKVKVYFPRELQSDSFTAYNILGVSHPLTLGTYSINQTQEFEILRWLEFGDEEVKIASTVINTCEGNPMRIYVKDSSSLAKLRVYVFDMLGYKIRELTVKGDVVEWRGENTTGTVPSGMYQIIVQGDKISKKFRVMVKQCQ
ncbi:MAG: hypothetical protein JNM63_13500, partial [Spirochaetia bacterium]|nr:hypothetical protein [Spirochaetia bacterium]